MSGPLGGRVRRDRFGTRRRLGRSGWEPPSPATAEPAADEPQCRRQRSTRHDRGRVLRERTGRGGRERQLRSLPSKTRPRSPVRPTAARRRRGRSGGAAYEVVTLAAGPTATGHSRVPIPGGNLRADRRSHAAARRGAGHHRDGRVGPSRCVSTATWPTAEPADRLIEATATDRPPAGR